MTAQVQRFGSRPSRRDHHGGLEPAQAGVHHSGGGRHTGQAEPGAEQRRQGGQPALPLGTARQHVRQHEQYRGATSEVLARVGRTLQAAGFGCGDLVDGIVYITDVNNFDAMNRAYRSVLKDLPARATVRAGLVNPEALVEIMFAASK